MGIFSSLKKIFTQPAQITEPNPHKEIRRNVFFLDENLHKHFLEYGWVVVKDVVKPEEIADFEKTYQYISSLEGFDLGETLLNSGRLINPEIRKRTREVVGNNAKTILPRMFDMSKVDTNTSGSFVAKPATDQSALTVHQDSTVIDEEKDYCLFVWIPFCDISEKNGPVWVLDGSHLWGNTQRSLGVPWYLEKHKDLLQQHMHPVLVNAGDAVIFDPALFHSSSNNMSDKLRLAVTMTVLRKDYQLVYYYKNKDASPDTIEKYMVDENFYFNYDFISKPDETRWKKETVPYKSFDLSSKELLKLIKAYKPLPTK